MVRVFVVELLGEVVGVAGEDGCVVSHMEGNDRSVAGKEQRRRSSRRVPSERQAVVGDELAEGHDARRGVRHDHALNFSEVAGGELPVVVAGQVAGDCLQGEGWALDAVLRPGLEVLLRDEVARGAGVEQDAGGRAV